MKRKEIVVVAAVIVILIAVIAILSRGSDQTIEESEASQQITQAQAEQVALDTNYDWVLKLNPFGRAELYDSVLENDYWKVRIRNYERLEDKKGFLIVYNIDLSTGIVLEEPFRKELE